MLLINFTILKYLIYKLVIIVINHIVFSAQNNKDELCNFLLFQESTFPFLLRCDRFVGKLWISIVCSLQYLVFCVLLNSSFYVFLLKLF